MRYTMRMESTLKVAIITGAGGGIGAASALRLAAAGWALALAGRDVKKLDAIGQQARAAGAAEALIQPADVSNPADCKKLVDAALARFRRIDALLNIAGHAERAPLAQTSDAGWKKAFAVNVDGAFYLTRCCWGQFTRQESGVVVNVSSMASIDPFPGFAAYASAKAALNMFTTITAREGADIGLTAVAIAPGAVETPMLRSLFSTRQISPTQTLSPDAVAKIIADCATGKRDFTSGQVIQINP